MRRAKRLFVAVMLVFSTLGAATPALADVAGAKVPANAYCWRVWLTRAANGHTICIPLV
jgi:hypothetical protein